MHFRIFHVLYCLSTKLLHTAYPMSLDAIQNNSNDNISKNTEQDDEILALPSTSEYSGTRSFTFGETLKLDDLGPIIINTDGTTRRITNWQNLTKQEQDTTWRVIRARNKKRIEELKQKELELNSNKIGHEQSDYTVDNSEKGDL